MRRARASALIPSVRSMRTPSRCWARPAQPPCSSIAGRGRSMSSRAEHGFTILEAVVALAIVGLAGVAALEAVGGEIRGVERARDAYTTAALAQHRMAEITTLAPEHLDPRPESVTRG